MQRPTLRRPRVFLATRIFTAVTRTDDLGTFEWHALTSGPLGSRKICPMSRFSSSRRVIALDNVTEPLELARKAGAEPVNDEDKDVQEKLRAMSRAAVPTIVLTRSEWKRMGKPSMPSMTGSRRR